MRTACPKETQGQAARPQAGWEGDRLAVSGRVAKAAKRRVKVIASCGQATTSKRVKPRRGRWQATLILRGGGASARRAKLTVR